TGDVVVIKAAADQGVDGQDIARREEQGAGTVAGDITVRSQTGIPGAAVIVIEGVQFQCKEVAEILAQAELPGVGIVARVLGVRSGTCIYRMLAVIWQHKREHRRDVETVLRWFFISRNGTGASRQQACSREA